MDMCAKPADANLLNGYALNGYVLVGYVLNGYVLVGYVLVGYVLNGYVWDMWICVDMCGVRYANNLLKNPAAKRLSGKTPRFVFCEVPMAFRWVEKRCFARFGELRTILGWLFGLFLNGHQRCNAGNL